jgi:hypothetical protein
MDRKTKAVIAVIACIIPITAVILVYSEPIVVYTHPFAVSCNWTCIDEQILQFEVNWPYIEWKVEVNVTEITGYYPGSGITRNITVYDLGGMYAYMEINNPEPGIYSTNWIPTNAWGWTSDTWNISIKGNGWYYGGFQGHITVYARSLIHVFIYGESSG